MRRRGSLHARPLQCARVCECRHVCELLCAKSETLCDCFFCSAPKQVKLFQPRLPPDEWRLCQPPPEPELPLVVVEQFAGPDEGAEDFSGGAEDESDDLTEVVKTPEVEPQVKE